MATKTTTTAVSTRTGRDGRSMTTEFATDEPNVCLSVFTFHRQGGVYRASAVGVRHMPAERGFSITESSPMDSKFLGQYEKGARFSAKNLAAVHADVLTMVREWLGADLTDADPFAAVLAAVPEAGA